MNKVFLLIFLFLASGCSVISESSKAVKNRFVGTVGVAKAMEVTEAGALLYELPQPKAPMFAGVYSFRDQTGQYKPSSGASSFSTAVTQGAGSMLSQALRDSRWFIPIEREGLQNLLTERRIMRASFKDKSQELPPLAVAQILFEGGIIGYNSNVKTGGAGAAYFGIDAAEQYREDLVTVYLRAVDVRTGVVLMSTTATKTILSQELTAGFFRFVSYKKLAEAEIGYTDNEPVSLATKQAIEKSVYDMILKGIEAKIWQSSARINKH